MYLMGDVALVGVGASEDNVIPATTSMLVEPSNEEFSSIQMMYMCASMVVHLLLLMR